MPTAYRYAVYLTPCGPWLELGRQWLGRCAESATTLPTATPPDWIAAPRRYGLHATLKAPFRLTERACPEEVDSVARALAARHTPFALPLVLGRLRGFLAWRMAPHAHEAQAAVHALAEDALRAFEPLRAPLNQYELTRRLATLLPPEQRAMLDSWGYPYALDTYVFHITLTDALVAPELAQARKQLLAHSRDWHQQAMPVARISIYVQPEPDADFVVARHYGFDGSTHDAVGVQWLHS